MLEQVRSEIASATLGRTERYKILVEDDPQMIAAVDLFPRASKLMSHLNEDTDLQPAPTKTSPARDETAGPPPRSGKP